MMLQMIFIERLKMSIKSKKEIGCINHREGNVKEFVEYKYVKESRT